MPAPCNCTTVFSSTVWLLPAATVGGRFTCETETLTVPVVVAPRASVTASWKLNFVFASVSVGTTNCACAVLALTRPTVGPPVWNQKNERASPSPSVEPLPSRVTVLRSAAVLGPPATTFGPWLPWSTVTLTVVVVVSIPSRTASWKTNVVSLSTSGAVKNGDGSVALLSAMTGAAGDSCVQEKVIASPSGSVPAPCNCTTVFVWTVWLMPAVAVGGRFTWATATLTVDVAVAKEASVTLSWKVNVEFPVTVGTANCAMAVFAPTMPTGGPLVWNQKNERASPSASVEPLPSRVTVVRSSAVGEAAASAMGAWFAWITVMLTVDGALLTWPSFTTRANVSTVGVATSGPMNVGFCAVALESTTAGPPVWVQAKVSGLASASVEALPSRVTVERPGTVSAFPALATGTRSGFVTVTATSEGRLVATPSLTVSWKTSVATVAAV